MGFPEFTGPNLDFSREIFTKIWNFHDISGSSVTKFPGILVEKTPRNAEIYGFHVFLGVKSQFSREFWSTCRQVSKKCRHTPGVHLQEYTGFPVPPGAHFGPQKRPPKIYLHLTAYIGVKNGQFLVEILQKMVTKFCKKFTKMLT